MRLAEGYATRSHFELLILQLLRSTLVKVDRAYSHSSLLNDSKQRPEQY